MQSKRKTKQTKAFFEDTFIFHGLVEIISLDAHLFA